MLNENQKSSIFEMRSRGISYAKIAEELKISKPTVIKYVQSYRNFITNLIEIQKDELAKSLENNIKSRITSMDLLYTKLFLEISQRDLSKENFNSLFKAILNIQEQFKGIEVPSFTNQEDFPFD